MDIADLRREYALAGLDRSDLLDDPFEQFRLWFELNARHPSGEPNAMTLSTVGADGAPSSRIVLLKGADRDGFRFFTNYDSRKGSEIAANPQVALNFHWYSHERQVNIQGRAERTSREESKEYFNRRPRGSRLGAMVSPQSSVVPDRAYLESRLQALEAEHAGSEPPLPEHWGGYLVRPVCFEFWQGRPNRLHDRFRYTPAPAGGWRIERLAP